MEYLQNKTVTVEGFKIEEGWLSISKNFNEKYLNHTDYGVESNLEASVMLQTTMNENLKKMGISREIVNTV